jgi:signal transduction histidine kinase
VTALVDAGALRQIVLNLLDNAIKFGPRGQTVRLIVERADMRARVIVEDEGPGIPLSDRERIWTPYVRLRREHSAASVGSGIGLAVVRELAELHGGTALVEESSTGGARFVIEMPVAGAPDEPPSLTPPTRRIRDRAREPQSWAGRARRRLARGLASPTKRS